MIHKIKTTFKIIKSYKNWFTWFLLYYKVIKKGQVKIITRNKLKFILSADSNEISRIGEIFHNHDYDPSGIKIKKNDTIIDIGAHVGFFTIYAAKKAKKVYAYEPLPENFKKIQKHITLNHLNNIHVFNKAVFNKKKKVKLYVSENSAYNSLFRKTEKYILIDSTTIETIFKENKIDHCNYLKIDCEGSEYAILFNLPTTFFKKIDQIVMEYHTGTNFNHTMEDVKKLMKFLETKGYKTRLVKASSSIGMIYATRL